MGWCRLLAGRVSLRVLATGLEKEGKSFVIQSFGSTNQCILDCNIIVNLNIFLLFQCCLAFLTDETGT